MDEELRKYIEDQIEQREAWLKWYTKIADQSNIDYVRGNLWAFKNVLSAMEEH